MAPVAQADSPTEVLSVTVRPPDGNVDDGFLTLQVDLELRDADGLPDRMIGFGGDDHATVETTRLGGPDALRLGVRWTNPQKVSGTATHGVWRATTEVSRGAAGEYEVSGLYGEDAAHHHTFTEIRDGTRFTVSAADVWDIVPTTAPVRITSGADLWVPSASIVSRRTGSRVGAGIAIFEWCCAPESLTRWPPPPRRGVRAGERWIGSAQRVDHGEPWSLVALAKRSRTAWSAEAVRQMCPTIKYQASAAPDATSVRRGDAITVTGKVWPAPTVYNNRETRPHLYLQHERAPGVWTRVATAFVRPSGRYTVSWEPQTSGAHRLRVWVPGSTSHCGTNAGTVTAPASMTVG